MIDPKDMMPIFVKCFSRNCKELVEVPAGVSVYPGSAYACPECDRKVEAALIMAAKRIAEEISGTPVQHH